MQTTIVLFATLPLSLHSFSTSDTAEIQTDEQSTCVARRPTDSQSRKNNSSGIQLQDVQQPELIDVGIQSS